MPFGDRLIAQDGGGIKIPVRWVVPPPLAGGIPGATVSDRPGAEVPNERPDECLPALAR